MIKTNNKVGDNKAMLIFVTSRHLEKLVYNFDQIVEEEKNKEQVPVESITFGIETGLKGNA
ncbi:MAG: hypothetical protein PHE84_03620 [bacterium]|nr:hypothetical protein [bacterium]